MLFTDIAYLDANLDYHPHAWIGVKDDVIDLIADCEPDASTAAAYGESYDGTGKLLMAAMYNAHAHAPMTLLRGYAEALPLQTWLFDRIFPFEAKITGEDCYWGTLLSCAEMARYGTVGFTDMYYHSEDRIRAVVESGLKMNSAEGLLALDGKPYREYPIYQKQEDLIAQHHGEANGRILIDYNIHAEYTCGQQTCADVAALAKEHGLNIHLHASETESEHNECRERHNDMTPIAYFESLGVFDVPVTAAHCVWATPEDIAILAKHHATVAYCPVSNMKLGSGFAPVQNMLDAGVNVALGTDGCASNNNLDMFQDMYVAALAAKGSQRNPESITPQQSLYMATRAGAVAQGRKDCGVIEQGSKADLCVLDVTGASWQPMTNPLANVVYAGHGSDVCLTMCDGVVVYKDGEYPTIDVEMAKQKTAQATQRIISEL